MSPRPNERPRRGPPLSPAEPVRRPGRWSGAIAATALLLVIVGAVAAALAGRPAPTPLPDAATPAAPALEGTVVRFGVDGARLEVRVDSAQATGVLQLEQAGGAMASAQVARGAAGEELVLLPASVQVRNARESRATYLVRIPRHVARIEVYVAGRLTALDAAALPRTLSLH